MCTAASLPAQAAPASQPAQARPYIQPACLGSSRQPAILATQRPCPGAAAASQPAYPGGSSQPASLARQQPSSQPFQAAAACQLARDSSCPANLTSQMQNNIRIFYILVLVGDKYKDRYCRYIKRCGNQMSYVWRPFFAKSCYKWQNCEAHCLESRICNFLLQKKLALQIEQ